MLHPLFATFFPPVHHEEAAPPPCHQLPGPHPLLPDPRPRLLLHCRPPRREAGLQSHRAARHFRPAAHPERNPALHVQQDSTHRYTLLQRDPGSYSQEGHVQKQNVVTACFSPLSDLLHCDFCSDAAQSAGDHLGYVSYGEKLPDPGEVQAEGRPRGHTGKSKKR